MASRLFNYQGHENLELISHSYRFNNWMYGQILPVLKGDILEVGSGLGVFSEKIIQDMPPHSKITLTDVSSDYLRELEKKFCAGNNKSDISVKKLDLNNEEDYNRIGYEMFDTIIAMNVLEHLQDDEFVLQQLYRMLKKEGILILLVPAYKSLYNVIDVGVGHFRRYSKDELEGKVRNAHFNIERIFYFNMLGIVGWYLNGNLVKKNKINANATKIFDRFVPFLRSAEKTLGNRVGLSIICYLRKESHENNSTISI
jgi:SAM-dependent methyltransferase